MTATEHDLSIATSRNGLTAQLGSYGHDGATIQVYLPEWVKTLAAATM
jgi:hypothetical protein